MIVVVVEDTAQALEMSFKQRLIGGKALGWMSINMWSLISRSLLVDRTIEPTPSQHGSTLSFSIARQTLLILPRYLCLGPACCWSARDHDRRSYWCEERRNDRKVFQVHSAPKQQALRHTRELWTQTPKQKQQQQQQRAFKLTKKIVKLRAALVLVKLQTRRYFFLKHTSTSTELARTFFIRIHTFSSFYNFRLVDWRNSVKQGLNRFSVAVIAAAAVYLFPWA